MIKNTSIINISPVIHMGDIMAYPKGKPRSEETKRKIRKAMQKKWQNKEEREKRVKAAQTKWDNSPELKEKFSKKFSGKGNPMYGKKQPSLTAWNKNRKGKSYEEMYGIEKGNKLRKKLEKLPRLKGKDHPSWKYGTKETYHNYARKIAYKHKKRECENCGSVWNLDVHHINEDWKNYDINNLQILCKKCHLRLYKIGKKLTDETKRKISKSVKRTKSKSKVIGGRL